jgi:hypothetical protein
MQCDGFYTKILSVETAMKIYVIKNRSGEYNFADDINRYISYNFDLDDPKLIFLYSYRKLRTHCRATLERKVTIQTESSSNELIAKYDLLRSCANCLQQTIITDGKKLQFEQGLSFQSSRK